MKDSRSSIEHVWNEAKHHISNHQRATFADTRHAFETYIQNNKFPYRLNKKDFDQRGLQESS